MEVKELGKTFPDFRPISQKPKKVTTYKPPLLWRVCKNSDAAGEYVIAAQSIEDRYSVIGMAVMLEGSKTEQDLFYHNVELYSLGRREYGTLKLTRHHFVFRCYPSKKKAEGSTSGIHHDPARESPASKSPSISTESSVAGETPSSIVNSVTRVPSEPSSQGGAKDSRPIPGKKERPVEIWVAYPLINHCILRPSHTPAHSIRFPGTEQPLTVSGEDDELFPPSYGTPDYTRPSSDSTRLAPYAPSPRPASPGANENQVAASSVERARQPAIRLRLKDFKMMALHFHSDQAGASPDDNARQAFYALRQRCCVENIEDLHALHFTPPKEERAATAVEYDARREYARMGIGSKAADGPGSGWRISDINRDYSYSPTYPSVLCVPRSVSDNMLKYGGVFRSKSRIPCLSYLHSNGGSITRSAQPMVGIQNKRNPQDERLVSAIFSSHAPPLQPTTDRSFTQRSAPNVRSATTLEETTTESEPAPSEVPQLPTSQSDTALLEALEEKSNTVRKRIYGSTRRSLIVDARPRINALANKAGGGGMEDVTHYKGSGEAPVERMFLNIANIHVMRSSLEKVVESFANSDYIKMKPDQEALRKSGWLNHIAGILEGTDHIAKAVGLGGSHVLVHCSDGWDRTAQVSGLAQIMLDPYCRTMNGFISLVQKEFLSFGHKCRDRNGIEGNEKWFEIENERIAPSRTRENHPSDATGLNAIGVKAFSGAKNWFEKSRGNLFRQQNGSNDNVADQSSSRPPSPPPNPLIHSSPSSTSKEEKGGKMSEKEVAPIFHQFLDTVYQLLYQNPNAFEFNERFLRRLFYQAYSCQYGEFLFNCERERNQYTQRFGSVWSHFLSRKREFTNPHFVPKVDDPLLFPNRSSIDREVEVRWWHELFGRSDEEMNVPRALARIETTDATANLPSTVSFDESFADANDGAETLSNAAIKESKSTPNLPAATRNARDSMSSLRIDADEPKPGTSVAPTLHRPSTDFEVVEKHSEPVFAESDVVEVPPNTSSFQQVVVEDHEGDPLGVMASMPKAKERSRLDFAAFASQAAFRDR